MSPQDATRGAGPTGGCWVERRGVVVMDDRAPFTPVHPSGATVPPLL